MASPVLQIRRGPATNIGLVTLRAGEPGFTTDKYELFVGTGTTITLGINTITSQLITAPNNKFLGAASYWSKETDTTGGGVNLLEATNNGNNYITLAAPNSLASNVQYTFPAAPIDGYLLKTGSSGVLEWSNQLPTTSTATNLTVGVLTVTDYFKSAGISTFSETIDSTTKDNGAVVIEGGVGIEKSVNIGGNLYVAGVSTFIGEARFEGGTINLGNDGGDDIIVGGEFASSIGPSTTASYDVGSDAKRWRGVYTQNLNVSAGATISANLAVGANADIVGHTTVDDFTASGIATFQNGIIAQEPPLFGYSLDVAGNVRFSKGLSVGGISTFNGAIDANDALSVDGVTTLNNNLSVSGFSTFQNGIQANSYLNLSGHANLSSTLNVSGITTVGGNLKANGGLDVTGHTELDSLNVTGIATFTNNFNVTGPAVFTNTITGTISTATRSITVDTTTTTADATYFLPFVDTPTGQNGETVRVAFGASFNPSTRTIDVDNLKSANIRSKDGTSAITLANTTGNVGVTSDLTVSGNLYVLGTSVEVNAETLKVEDSLIEVGLVNTAGLLGAPTSDLNIDVGILLHWYNAGAKKAAAFWDDSAGRIVLASDVSETSSVITVNTYASLEIGNLWINDCAGQSQLISCVNSERLLNNITVDGGSF